MRKILLLWIFCFDFPDILNVDTQFLADLINDLNDKYWKKDKEMTEVIDNSENIIDRLFENLYKTESWY